MAIKTFFIFCRLDTDLTYYVVGFKPNATKMTAHHMLVYGCEEPGQFFYINFLLHFKLLTQKYRLSPLRFRLLGIYLKYVLFSLFLGVGRISNGKGCGVAYVAYDCCSAV